MWCLTPLLPSNSQPADHELNPVRFLVAGSISIGRSAKKTSKTGGADLLIHGEGSVSSLHAVLQVEPAAPDGQQGAVYITDSSKYGTHVRRGAGGGEERLPAGQRVQLGEGDVLRFGSKCRYQLTAVPLVLAAPPSSHARLAAPAAAAGARLTQRCEEAASHALASDGEQLSPLLLRALLEGVPLATPQWLAALAAGKAWGGALPDPAADAAHAPQQLQLPPLQQQQQHHHHHQPQHQQQQVLELASWQVPAADLLARFVLVFQPGCEPDLQGAAATLGAHTQCSPAADATARLASNAAAASSRAVLVVTGAAAAAGAAGRPEQAAISEQQLLLAMATGVCAALDAAVAAAAAAAAAAAQQVSVADSEDEAEETEEGEEAPEEELEPIMPVLPVLSTRSRGGSQAGARAPPAPSGQAAAAPAPSPAACAGGRGKKRGAVATSATPSPQPAAAADDDAGAAQEPAGKRLKLSSLPARADAPAAAPSPPGAAAASGGGRRRRGATLEPLAGADGAATQEQQQQQQQQQGGGGSGGSAAQASRAAANGPLLSRLQLTRIGEGVFTAPLIVASPPRPGAAAAAAAAAAAGSGSVDHKAFRRKQLGQLQAAAMLPDVPPPPVLRLVPYDRQYAGADADAFMKDERARLERLKKADELFNASIKPTKAPAKAAASAAKPPAKPRKPATKMK